MISCFVEKKVQEFGQKEVENNNTKTDKKTHKNVPLPSLMAKSGA